MGKTASKPGGKTKQDWSGIGKAVIQCKFMASNRFCAIIFRVIATYYIWPWPLRPLSIDKNVENGHCGNKKCNGVHDGDIRLFRNLLLEIPLGCDTVILASIPGQL
jgi:hypothetical protein